MPSTAVKDREEEEAEEGGSGSGSGSEDENQRISIKVLYTPDTPLTRSIMEKANRVFSVPEYFKEWAEQVANCSQFFLDTFPPNSSAVQRLNDVRYTLMYTTVEPLLKDTPELRAPP